jgi:hypothetical protein
MNRAVVLRRKLQTMTGPKSKGRSRKRETVDAPVLSRPRDRDLVGGLYAAKLLFEFFIVVDGQPGIRRLCEERMILVEAGCAEDALRIAKSQGRGSQWQYRNANGDPVHFRFVGVMDLLHLGSECAPNEVWYGITQRVRPMERKRKLLPREAHLCAVVNERGLLPPRRSRRKKR